MRATLDSTTAKTFKHTLACAGLAVALAASACQNVSTFVTGDNYPTPPKGTQRVEAEVEVTIDDSVYDDLDEQGLLAENITDLVLAESNLGLRFYGVLGAEYDDDDLRPAYLMSVQIDSLVINTKHEDVAKAGEKPRIESSIETLDCMVRVTIKKRRAGGPPLLVGNGQGKGRVNVRSKSASDEQAVTYAVVRTSDKHQDLRVRAKDLLDVVDEAVVYALRQVVPPVDRELTMDAPAKP